MMCKERPGYLLETAGGSGMDVHEGSPGQVGVSGGGGKGAEAGHAMGRGCREAGGGRDEGAGCSYQLRALASPGSRSLGQHLEGYKSVSECDA